MTTKDKALESAIDAFEALALYAQGKWAGDALALTDIAIDYCRAALTEKDEQEPVAAQCRFRVALKSHPLYVEGSDFGPWHECSVPRLDQPLSYIDSVGYEVKIRLLYTAPPKRKPLTDDELNVCAGGFQVMPGTWCYAFARAIEAHQGIGGEA